VVSKLGSGYLISPAAGSPRVSRRTLTFLLVACLHAAVFYGLLIGASTITTMIPKPLVTRVIDSPRRDALPPLPGPHLAAATIPIPSTIADFEIEPAPADAIRVATGDAQGAGPPAPVPRSVNRQQGGPGAGFPSTNDFYPSLSIYRGEEGAATIEACVDGRGRLTSEPKVIESARSARLDEAALKLAKAGSGHYRASTEDGQPVNSCYAFRVRFTLRK
jgi:TonB family protein